MNLNKFLKTLNLELTSHQKLAAATLGWLFDESDENRRTGRSTFLALTSLWRALDHPGKKILLQDHLPLRLMDECLFNRLNELAHRAEKHGLVPEGTIKTTQTPISVIYKPLQEN